jgi:hypothetical protein
MTIGDESCDQIDQEVDGTAMARMLDLAAIFELIRDGLDDGAFAQEELVRPLEQAVVHLLTQLGDEVQPVGDQQLPSSAVCHCSLPACNTAFAS